MNGWIERERGWGRRRKSLVSENWLNFERGSDHRAQESFEKIPSDTIERLAAGDHEFPHPLRLRSTRATPATEFATHHRRHRRCHHPSPSGIGGVKRHGTRPRRVDLKQDDLKGVFPLSAADGLSDKSIYVLANEGGKWRFLIGRWINHTPFVHKGSGRKPVSLCYNS